MKREDYKAVLASHLLKQIEEVHETFKNIQGEVAGIVNNNNVSDSTAHLEDVLQSTENATNTILDSASAIQEVVDKSCVPDQQSEIGKLITQIYEACNFQDITGQRIKKVLKNLSLLESRLSKLAESAKNYAGGESKPASQNDDPLLNGPQLTNQAPTQADIDKLFSS